MHIFAHSFGSGVEDAYWPEEYIDQEIEGDCFFAAADGASDALFSGLWASMLVSSYGRGQLSAFRENRLPGIFEQLQKEWQEKVEQCITRPLPWYFDEEKLRDGAFSTLIGLTIRPPSLHAVEEGEWEAIAIGDSCLFHVRDNQCLLPFPLKSAEQFNTNPHLIPSNAYFNQRIISDVLLVDGYWKAGDEFYLMTDALACWFLCDAEQGNTGLDNKLMEMRQLQTPNDFEQWITRLRQDQVLRHDDTTLLRIKLGE